MNLKEIEESCYKQTPLCFRGGMCVVTGITRSCGVAGKIDRTVIFLTSLDGRGKHEYEVHGWDDVTAITPWVGNNKGEIMDSKDKYILEMIKALAECKVLEYKPVYGVWCESQFQTDGKIKELIQSIVIDNENYYRIKPKTKKIVVRSWLTNCNNLMEWTPDCTSTQLETERRDGFKQWLDPVDRVYEVEI